MIEKEDEFYQSEIKILNFKMNKESKIYIAC